MRSDTRDRRRLAQPNSVEAFENWVLGVLLVTMVVFAYHKAWSAGYVWDDDIYVTKNKLLTAPDGLWRIWFSLDSPSQYFPLTYTTFRLEHALWGLSPAGYHWVNIFLHAANALLVWRLLNLLGVPAAWLGTALFALHPVQVESVAWVTERKNVLMGLFFLLALISWVKFVDAPVQRRWRYYGLALIFYLLALFSKTTACTLPAALLLILWWKEKPITWRWLTRIVLFVLFGIGMGLLTIWWERYHQGFNGETFQIGLIERVLVASRAIWFYLGKLLWPVDLIFSYPRWTISRSNPFDYIWLVITASAATLLFVWRRSLGRGPEVAALFFVATLSPMLGLIMLYTFRFSFVADHYQYLACIGPLTVIATGITTVVNRAVGNQQWARGVVSAAFLIPLGILTWKQGAMYADLDTLWAVTLTRNPASWMACNNLGLSLERQGRTDEAIAYYRRGLALNATFEEAHGNLGNVLVKAGQLEEGITHYQYALQDNPRNVRVRYNLALTLVQSDRIPEAISQYDKVLATDPDYAAAHDKLFTTLKALGKVDEAVAAYITLLETDPGNVEAHYNLGRILFQGERLDQAADHFNKVLDLKPNNVAAHLNLAEILRQQGRISEAKAHFQQAREARKPGR